MIYFFYWDNSFDIKNEITSWKERFISKFWDFNFFHLKDLTSTSQNEISDILLASSFMAEKKLVIIENYPTSETKDFDEFFLANLKNIPADTIVLLSSSSPDKRSKIYKTLIKEADQAKEFKARTGQDLYNFLLSKNEWKITSGALNLLMKFKQENALKIQNEIDKLSILYPQIDEKAVKENVLEELEESIFDFINSLLAKDSKNAILKMRVILEQTNIYAFYSAFSTNLTNTYFIEMYKSLRKPKDEIIRELDLWKKWFLVDKRHKINFKELELLYLDILSIDKKMKTGEVLDYWDSYIEYELEKAILKHLSA